MFYMKEKITCPMCEGHGEVLLEDAFPLLADTLALFKPSNPIMTALEVHRLCKDGVGVPAIHIRLERLRLAKFLQRQKRKGSYVYFRSVKGK